MPKQRLFSVDEIGDSEMVFGEMRQRIRHRLPGIHLTVAKNPGKKPNQVQPVGYHQNWVVFAPSDCVSCGVCLENWFVYSNFQSCRGRVNPREQINGENHDPDRKRTLNLPASQRYALTAMIPSEPVNAGSFFALDLRLSILISSGIYVNIADNPRLRVFKNFYTYQSESPSFTTIQNNRNYTSLLFYRQCLHLQSDIMERSIVNNIKRADKCTYRSITLVVLRLELNNDRESKTNSARKADSISYVASLS
ncbi:hypothetical protein ANN_14856 [Periplaneta americana]|uniref:Uncharacterized protein n=1 Tax=Periplaneta americana TaxID=6978 RepID=A0ABQ8SZ17_PERAM|nr:hypothetical protein ANN_14856 [Periplaneta americana]